MHLLKCEVLVLDPFLQTSLHLFTTFSIDINVPPSRTQKVGFSALVQQEMLEGIDIGI